MEFVSLKSGKDYLSDHERRAFIDGITPLVNTLKKYDKARLTLEENGGTVKDLRQLKNILTETFKVNCADHNSCRASLVDPQSLRSALRAMDGELHLDVRRLPDSGFPCYYLCRTRSSFFSVYRLVVEDLYISPGFPIKDDRFIKLRLYGREQYFLRLGQFRKAMRRWKQLADFERHQEFGSTKKYPVEHIFPVRLCQDYEDKISAPGTIDNILLQVGMRVLQAAWHEDQIPGFQAANHFSMPKFKQCGELLYMILAADLCDLRGLDPIHRAFFRDIYPQAAIHQFLENLHKMDGKNMNETTQRALRAYAELGREFNLFLQTEVSWRQKRLSMPLAKLLFANLWRMEELGRSVQESKEFQPAKEKLEHFASNIIEQLLTLSE